MKRSKLIECVRRLVVAVLVTSMAMSGMPVRAIADTLSIDQMEAAAESGSAQAESSQDGWTTSVEPIGDEPTDSGDAPSGEDVVAPPSAQGAVPEEKDGDGRDTTLDEQGPADKSPEGEKGVSGGQPSAEPAIESDEPAGDQAGASSSDDATGIESLKDEKPIDGTALEHAKLVDAPELSPDQEAELMPDLRDSGPVDEGDRAARPQEADGTRIERVSVEWITDRAGQGTLALKPKTNDPVDVRMRMNVAFSGQHDYEPGKMRLTVPKSILKYRDGSPAGAMSTSVPEAPDTRALFSYVELDDVFVLTNTRTLTAATSAMFEFTIHDVVPNKMNGNPASYTPDPFWATASVVTAKGTEIELTSNSIHATFDTSEQIISSENSVVLLSEAWDDSWPAELKPANAGSYVFCDFYSWATIKGNQDFKMEVQHTATVDGRGATVLGLRDQDGKVYSGGGPHVISQSGYSGNATRDYYVHAYVAVPKSKVPDNGKYTFKDDVTYTLTSVDDKQVTRASGSAQQVYAPLAFVNPGGHFNVFKSGSVAHREDDNTYQWGDPDPLALNDLRDGRDILSTWKVETLSFNAPWTAPNGKPTAVDQMEQRKVKTMTDDGHVQFAANGRDLTSADFEFASLRVPAPEVYRYQKFTENSYGWSEESHDGYVVWQKIPAGSFGYKPVEDPAKIPDVEVLGAISGGAWQKLAVVSFRSGEPRLTWSASGVSLDGDTVNFAKGMNVTDLRTVINTERSGVIYYTYPTARIKATPSIKKQVNDLFKNSSTPSTVVRNKAEMAAREDGGSGREIIKTQLKAADNKISGASLGVRAFKTMSVKNDKANRLARLHYKVAVHEQSNLATKAQYKQAIERGIIQEETSGVFYDLLPKHVVPDLRSIALRSGDGVKDIRTVENYRGSGRTLLVVQANLKPRPEYKKEAARGEDVGKNDGASIIGEAGYCDTPTLEFDAVYTWEDLTDLGAELNNVVAFESGNKSLGTLKGLTGEPDNPRAGKNETSASAVAGVEDLMTDLNPAHDNSSFVYANCRDMVNVDVDALTGLQKHVSVNNDGVYGDGLGDPYPLNVYEGGEYTYRLRIQNDDKTMLKGVVLYDDLENYVPGSDKDDHGDRQWRGSLIDVDVSSLEAQGVKPVVYYSTKVELTLDEEHNVGQDGALKGDLDLSNGSIWTTMRPADPASITGIAIDCSHAKGGGDFVLQPNSSMGARIKMRAPHVRDLDDGATARQWFDTRLEKGHAEGDDSGLYGGAHAYNNVSRVAWEINKTTGSTSERKLVTKDYTKVGLLNASIVVKKAWDDHDDADGVRPQSVTVHLLANDKDCGLSAVLDTSNDWSYTFEAVPRVDDQGHLIRYSLKEDDVPGYTWSTSWKSGNDPAEPEQVVVTNRHETEKTRVDGVKTWEDAQDGAGKRPDSVVVDLYENGEKVESKTVRPDDRGEWSYSFENLDKYYDHGKLVQYEVREDTYYAGYVPSVEGTNVRNTYNPFGDLSISKQALDATPQAAHADCTFKVEFTRENGKPDAGQYEYVVVSDAAPDVVVDRGQITNGGTLPIKAGQTATIKHIPSETSYMVKEVNVPGFLLTGRVNDRGSIVAGQNMHAQFTNTYRASGEAHVMAHKTLEGRKLAAYQFRFDLVDETGTVVATASNDNEGAVRFGALRYGLKDLNADGRATRRYTIREQALAQNPNGAYVTDTAEYGVRVNLEDNGKGKIAATVEYDGGKEPTFSNRYSAKGSIALSAWKELEGGDLGDYGPFQFALLDGEGQQVGRIKQNDASGTIKFDPISFTEKDAGKTYTYTAYEVQGPDARVQYDDARFTYTVHVVDNGDGTLSFEQTSNAVPVFNNGLKPGDLRIEKRIDGGDPDQEFTFRVQLTGEDGQQLPQGKLEYDRVQLTDGLSNKNARPAPAAAASTGVVTVPEYRRNMPISLRNAAGGADASLLLRRNGSMPGLQSSLTTGAPSARNTAPASGTVVKSGLSHDGKYGDTARWTLYSDGTLAVDGGTIEGREDTGADDWFDASIEYDVHKIVFNGTHVKWLYGLLCDAYPRDIAGSIDLTGCHSRWGGTADNQALSLDEMFSCNSLVKHSIKTIDLTAVGADRVSASQLFDGCFDLEKARIALPSSVIENTYSMFRNCAVLTDVDLSAGFDCSGATDMSNMFAFCPSLARVEFAQDMGTAGVANFNSMFNGCRNLDEVDLSGFDFSSAQSMEEMFCGCLSLGSVDFGSSTAPHLRSVRGMFDGAPHVRKIDLSFMAGSSHAQTDGLFNGCGDVPLTVVLPSEFEFTEGCSLPIPYKNETYTGKWVREDMPGTSYTSDELKAAWNPSMAGTYVWEKRPKEYTVVFDANAGGDAVTGSMAPQTWNVGTYGTMPDCNYKRFNYDFAGWNTRPDGSGTSYAAGEQLNEDLATEAAIIHDLPAGVGYVVSELTPAGWQLYSSSGTTGAIKPTETSTAAFNNRQDPSATSATLSTRKLLDGKPAPAGAFEFGLYEVEWDGSTNLIQTKQNGQGGSVQFDTIRYTSPEDHTYVIREIDHSDAQPNIRFDGHEERVNVWVHQDPSYQLVAEVTYSDGSGDTTPGINEFRNTTKPGSLTVTKHVLGELSPSLSPKEFQFRVDWNGGKTSTLFTLHDGESRTFSNLAPGTTYKVTEIGMPSGYVQQGIIGGSGANGTGTIVSMRNDEVEVNNRYYASGTAVVQAHKQLEGNTLEDGQFAFELIEQGTGVKYTSVNGADGSVTFGPLEYTRPGTYTYIMREVQHADDDIIYSDAAHRVTVRVADNGDGSLKTSVSYDGGVMPPTFVNKVKPGGTLRISKEVVNGTPATKDAAFTFTVKLMDIDGKELSGTYEYTKSDGDTGQIASGDTLQLKAGQHVDIAVPLGSTYKVTEASAPGFTSSSQNAQGSVASEAVVEAVFTNTYDAKGSFAPRVTKTMVGGSLSDGQFTFKLFDDNGEVLQTAENDTAGDVFFDPIAYALADVSKTFEYRIQEVNDHQENIEYDGNEVLVRVTVTDNGDGTLSTEATYDGEPSAGFVNRRRVVLPITGQAGIAIGVAVGLAVIAVSAVALVRRKKR